MAEKDDPANIGVLLYEWVSNGIQQVHRLSRPRLKFAVHLDGAHCDRTTCQDAEHATRLCRSTE